MSISYRVGDQHFYNKFQAAHYAAGHSLDMHFDLHESAFDQVNWMQEPETSWDTLLDIRARQIAAKNKPIVFYFSGGTDSLTIYKVFERNNIHVDLVWMRAWEFGIEKASQVPVIDLMHNNFYDKTTRIVIQNGDELMAQRSYTNDDWIWEQGMRHQYGIVGGDKNSNDEIAKMLGVDDFVAIIGFEKPRLHFTATGVYSYQDDENYVRPMADPRFDCFFINPDLPELHVKQSHMMLNYVRTKQPDTQKQMIYNDFHVASKFHWHEYSISACGRYGDINYSHLAHIGNFQSKLILPSKDNDWNYQGRARRDFIKFKEQQTFKHYVNGIMSVAKDSAGKYLLTDSNNFYSVRPYRSKYYKIA